MLKCSQCGAETELLYTDNDGEKWCFTCRVGTEWRRVIDGMPEVLPKGVTVEMLGGWIYGLRFQVSDWHYRLLTADDPESEDPGGRYWVGDMIAYVDPQGQIDDAEGLQRFDDPNEALAALIAPLDVESPGFVEACETMAKWIELGV